MNNEESAKMDPAPIGDATGPAADKRTTLLFVEDSPSHLADILQAIDRFEPTWSYEVVGDALTAFRWLTVNVPSIIVIDVMLPAVPGVPALAEGAYLAAMIRAKREVAPTWRGHVREDSRGVPIVFLTARGAANLHEQLNEIGLPGAAIADADQDPSEWSAEACVSGVIAEKSSAVSTGVAFLKKVLRPLVPKARSVGHHA